MSLRVLNLVVTLVVLGTAGCGRPATTEEAKRKETPSPRTLRHVVFQADWFPQAEQGGYFQALARGLYREVGLDVEIRPGGTVAGIKLPVAKGEADFGMNRSDDVMVAVSRGIPLRNVAATFQHDPPALQFRPHKRAAASR